MPVVHHVRCTLSIHTCTALNRIPVRHLHTTDMMIEGTVSSHRFHYRSPISICLPHCATIWMCDICGASWPMHVINPHLHCSKLCPGPALSYHRYSNNNISTYTPASLLVTHFHLLATLHHHTCIYYSQCHTPYQHRRHQVTLWHMQIHDGQWWLLNAERVSCYISEACYKCMVAKSVMHVLHHVRNILSTHAFMTVNCIPVLCVQPIVIMIKVPSAGFYRSSMVVTRVIHVVPHVGCM